VGICVLNFTIIRKSDNCFPQKGKKKLVRICLYRFFSTRTAPVVTDIHIHIAHGRVYMEAGAEHLRAAPYIVVAGGTTRIVPAQWPGPSPSGQVSAYAQRKREPERRGTAWTPLQSGRSADDRTHLLRLNPVGTMRKRHPRQHRHQHGEQRNRRTPLVRKGCGGWILGRKQREMKEKRLRPLHTVTT
jgi:hypothetical protein